MEESGLLDNDLDMESDSMPPELSSAIAFASIPETDEIQAESLFGGDFAFQYYDMSSPPSHLSV